MTNENTEVEIKKKEITYRGVSVEEMKNLDVREFAKYLTSRQKRKVLRQFQKIESFVSRANTTIKSGKPVRTHQRDLVIVPGMIGMKIDVHNGRIFSPVQVTGDMIGHTLGEFSVTRSRVKHSKAGIGATKGSKFKAKK